MKQILLPALLCCLLPLGCQSASLSPSRFSNSLLGPKKSEHTLSSTAATASSKTPSAQSEFLKGEESLKKNDLNGAKKHFKNVVQQTPDHAGAHHRLAYIADQKGEFSIAEIHYLSAHRIDPKNVDVLCDWGYSYLMQDRFADSRRYLEKALAINPQHKSTLLNLATLHGKQGDYDGSLALFRQAGSEQEAQANIARLFPQGRPPGGGTMLAQTDNSRKEISPATRDLQQKLAQSRQTPPAAQQPFPADLTKMDPRDIPPERINEVFAQIDQQFDRKYQQSPIETVNHTEPFPAHPSQQSAQHVQAIAMQPAVQQPSTPSSLPGELPLTRQADPFQNTAVLGADSANLPTPPGLALPASTGRENPYFQAPPVQAAPQVAQNMSQQPWMDAPQMNPPAQTPQGLIPTTPIAELPFQTPPPRSNGGGLARNPAAMPAPGSAAQLNYEQAMAQALLLGMSAGPGQMFPTTGSNSPPSTPAPPAFNVPGGYNAANATPGTPTGATLSQPFGTPGDFSKPAENSFLNLPQTTTPPATPPLNNTAPPAFTVTPTGTQTLSDKPANTTPLDWPYAEQQVQRPIQQTSGALPETTPATTPWFNPAPTPSSPPVNPGNSLPQTNPAASYQTPQQWPYSPQQIQSPGSGSTQSQPVMSPGSMGIPSGAPQNPAANALPQVVPGVR